LHSEAKKLADLKAAAASEEARSDASPVPKAAAHKFISATAVQRQIQWLLEGPIRSADGMLAAWVDPSGPSHLYEESTGYLILLLCRLYKLTDGPRFKEEALRSVRALTQKIDGRNGCGREQSIYLFDTAVCARSLAVFFAAFPDLQAAQDLEPTRLLLQRLAQTARRMFLEHIACEPPTTAAGSQRWSEIFGPHLIKAAHHLLPWMTKAGDQAARRETVNQLIAEHYRDGLFYQVSLSDPVYMHAHCYAVEGLLAMPDAPARVIDETARRMAQLQSPEGGLPKWWPQHAGADPAADATAQTVRIWQCVDPTGYAPNIEAGLSYLKQMSDRQGGVLYSPRSGHLNSWTTIFFLQALLWAAWGAEAGSII